MMFIVLAVIIVLLVIIDLVDRKNKLGRQLAIDYY